MTPQQPPATGSAPAPAAAAGLTGDMGPVHWAVVALLAASGLITAQVVRHQGKAMCELHAASLAMLVTVAASQLLLQQPSPLFYVACCFAAAATMQLQDSCALYQHPHLQTQHQQHRQQQQQQQQQLDARAFKKVTHAGNSSSPTSQLYILGALYKRTIRLLAGSSSSSSHACSQGVVWSASKSIPGRPPSEAGLGEWVAAAGFNPQAVWWLLAFLDRLAVSVMVLSLLLLLLLTTAPSVPAAKAGSSKASTAAVYLQHQQHQHQRSRPQAAAAAVVIQGAAANSTTGVPMDAAVAAMPCVDGTWLQRDRFCPVINCSLAPSCTVLDPDCCAHLNLQMLAYLDALLAARGLTGQYAIMYGTLLGE